MPDNQRVSQGQWSGNIAFVLAATGSAVGLGNIWKFPYITGQNGGGAFVLVYLVCITFIGIPVMMGEILIGRRGRQSPINAVSALAQEAGAPQAWKYMGAMGILAGFLILSYYSVIAGWAVSYVYLAGIGSFTGADAAEIGKIFGDFTGDWVRVLGFNTLVLGATVWVVARGVKGGLERTVKWMMPGLLAIILILVGYAMSTGHFRQGFNFLFKPDFNHLTANGFVVALGHAFFTLSLASGAIMAYGAYLPKSVSIAKTTFYIAGADTAVALLAGLAIFPIVFAHGLEPGQGPGLIFQTLPLAFGQMPFGRLMAFLFFVMLVFAAFTSAISLVEPSVAWVMERFGWSRVRACLTAGAGVWLLGLGSVFSFNLLNRPLLFNRTFFDLMDYLTSNIMLPIGGFLVAGFCAWAMKEAATKEELGMGDSPVYKAWLFVMRFVAPALIILVFLNSIGVLSRLLPAG